MSAKAPNRSLAAIRAEAASRVTVGKGEVFRKGEIKGRMRNESPG